MMQGAVINAIGVLRVENLSGDIKGTEVGAEDGSEDRATALAGGEGQRKGQQVNRQDEQADELNERPVQAVIQRGSYPIAKRVQLLCSPFEGSLLRQVSMSYWVWFSSPL